MATGLSRRAVAEGQAAQGAHLLLELVGAARVERPVPAVVRPRGDLVDEEPAAVGDEQLDAQHADVVQLGGEAPGEAPRFLGRARRRCPRGTTVVSRMPSRCRFSPTGNGTTAPSEPRANTTDSSCSRASRSSSTHGTRPSRVNASSALEGCSTVTWPLPS